jgi:hypothetical protein
MSFDRKRNIFKCFSCNTTGDTIALVKMVTNKTFRDCVSFIIGEDFNTDIKFKPKPIIQDGLIFFCDKCNRKINKLAWMIFSYEDTNKYCDYCATQVYNLLVWESLYLENNQKRGQNEKNCEETKS